MYVCVCHGVTEKQIKRAVSAGASNVADLGRELGVATCCGTCQCSAEQVIEESRHEAGCMVNMVGLSMAAAG